MNAPPALPAVPRAALARTDHRIAPADALGLSLYARHVRPPGPTRGTVVLVHGATLASGLWDIAVPGYSMLEALATAGWSSWALDIRGYARSQRLHQPVLAYAGLEQAVRDIGAVVEHACRSDGREQVLLVGGSWGSITSARYATEFRHRVRGLALMAPIYALPNALWLADLAEPEDPQRLRSSLGATRRVGRPELLRRWDPEIPYADHSRRREERVLEALMQDALAAEDGPAADAYGGVFTVPNGTLHDLFVAFSGQPLYDAARLTMPTLLVRGEDDQTSTADDAALLCSRLRAAPTQLETLPDAGHFVCAERAAPLLQRKLREFFARL